MRRARRVFPVTPQYGLLMEAAPTDGSAAVCMHTPQSQLLATRHYESRHVAFVIPDHEQQQTTTASRLFLFFSVQPPSHPFPVTVFTRLNSSKQPQHAS
jgi:hypothetical protein